MAARPKTTKPADEAPAVESPKVDAPAPAPEADAVAESDEAGAPDARIAAAGAPLEAPPAPAKVEEPAEDENTDAPQTAGNLGAAMVRNAVPGSRLIDNATGETPDPDTLFEKIEGAGVQVQCMIRLLQKTWIGPHEAPIVQLVMPQTQITSPEKAAQILAVLREQIANEAADAEADASSE